MSKDINARELVMLIVDEKQADTVWSDDFMSVRNTQEYKKIDLRKESYRFTLLSEGENNERFKLYYVKPYVDDVFEEKEELDLVVFVDVSKNLQVEIRNTTDQINRIQLFDLLGREIINFLPPEEIKGVSKLKTGVYIVSVTLGSNKKINKKIVITN